MLILESKILLFINADNSNHMSVFAEVHLPQVNEDNLHKW